MTNGYHMKTITVGIDQLRPSPLAPSGSPPSPPADLIELVRVSGIDALPVIKVRQIARSPFSGEILHGVSAWRAAQLVGIHEVSVQIIDVDEDAAKELVRQDYGESSRLDPIAAAKMIRHLTKTLGINTSHAASTLGIRPWHGYNLVRLLDLPLEIQEYLKAGQLKTGHGKALVSLPRDHMLDLARRAVQKHWSVRDLESAIRDKGAPRQTARAPDTGEEKPVETIQLENTLSEAVGSPVVIEGGSTHGRVVIEYHGDGVLEGIIERLLGSDRGWEWD